MEIQKLMTVADCAKILRISEGALATMMWRGSAPKHMKLGKNVRFHPDDITSYIDSLRGIKGTNDNHKKPGRPRKSA